MLLGEPPRSGGDLNFVLLGIPVRVHPMFWLIAVLLHVQGAQDATDMMIWIVAVFISILVHEFGHALAMRYYGQRPWITLTGFGGLASADPSDSQRLGTTGNVLISFAGPGTQFLMVAALAAILTAANFRVVVDTSGIVPLVFPGGPVVSPGLTMLLFYLMVISVYWGVLNLLPIYPLDGGQIARELFLAVSPRNGIVQSLMLSIGAGAVVALLALREEQVFMAILFGLLAYGSYAALQGYRNHRGW